MNLKYLYVVEGKTDINKLKLLGAAFVISTNGFSKVSCETLFIKHVLKKRKVILLLDPDGPGKQIANSILNGLNDEEKREVILIELKKEFAATKKKVGVAEAKLDYLISVLKNYLKHDDNINEVLLTYNDLVETKLTVDKDLKKLVMNSYNFYASNSKALLNRLNCLGLSKEDLYEKIR